MTTQRYRPPLPHRNDRRSAEAGGQPANRVARWDGESWSPLGGGVNNVVQHLKWFDDGSWLNQLP